MDWRVGDRLHRRAPGRLSVAKGIKVSASWNSKAIEAGAVRRAGIDDRDDAISSARTQGLQRRPRRAQGIAKLHTIVTVGHSIECDSGLRRILIQTADLQITGGIA